MSGVEVAIAHAAWAEDRKAPLDRLLEQLDAQGAKPLLFASTHREHASVWWIRILRELAQDARQGPDAWIVLNDDVDVSPKLLEHVAAMLVHLPDEILSLHTQLPAAKSLAELGANYLRSYWASGPGYVLPRGTPKKILEWYAQMPRIQRESWNEDGWLNLFSYMRRRPIWHSIPALVQHRTEVRSTLGYDDHTLRTATVDWRDMAAILEHKGKRWWRPEAPAPFLENPWMTTDQLVGLEREFDRGDRYSLIIATPHQGWLHHAHVASVHQILRARGLDAKTEAALNHPEIRWLQEQEDLTRCRSRMLRTAYVNGGSHLLFVDSDGEAPVDVVAHMLLSGKDFVQAPYPRRDGRGYSIKGTAKRRAEVEAAKAEGAGLPVNPADVQADDTLEIDGTGLGLTLISRDAMKRLLEHYADEPLPVKELRKRDTEESGTESDEQLAIRCYELGRSHGYRLKVKDHRFPGAPAEDLVALFMLMVRDGELLGEDLSFAQRWKDIGGQVWLYVGPGTPVVHYGDAAFVGKIEDFGIRRA